MSTKVRMTTDERRKCLRKMEERYSQADRRERGRLLNEIEAVTELHRISLSRLMKGSFNSAQAHARWNTHQRGGSSLGGAVWTTGESCECK